MVTGLPGFGKGTVCSRWACRERDSNRPVASHWVARGLPVFGPRADLTRDSHQRDCIPVAARV